MNQSQKSTTGWNEFYILHQCILDRVPSKLQNLLLSETNNNVNNILPSICQLVFSFSLNTHT